MASASDSSTDGAFLTSISGQTSPIPDLYGLLAIETPKATNKEIRMAYEVITKNLLPELPSKAAEAALSILTTPATRAQYDSDHHEYLHGRFKSDELSPGNAAVDDNKALENQIETYATVLKYNICDALEKKKAELSARLAQLRKELDEYEEKAKGVQEEWATISNQIVRKSVNALREVEISALADMKMLENELDVLRGELPAKDVDGPPSKIAKSQYGSDEMTKNSESLRSPQTANFNSMAVEVKTTSTNSSSISSAGQSPPGIGLVKSPELHGYHKMIISAQKKVQKPWVTTNDSVTMPSQPSSFIRTDPHAGGQPTKNTSDSSSLFNTPTRPFQRTRRGVMTPMGKLRTKPGLSNISDVMKKQELGIAQPMPKRPEQTQERPSSPKVYFFKVAFREMFETTEAAVENEEPLTSSNEEAEIKILEGAEYEESKLRAQVMKDAVKQSIEKFKQADAARTLIRMSRLG